MRDLTYPPVIAAAKTAFRLLGVRFDLRGTENVPEHGPAMLAFNHVSYVDFVFGGFAAQPSRRLVRFMAKRELFTHRLTGPLMRSLHHIEVDRGEGLRSYEEALRYLADGEVVGIFPEATISRAMELKEIKTGAARLAAQAGVPLIPVVLWGTQRMMTKDHPKDFSRGHQIAITVGSPLHPTGASPIADTTELKAALTRLLDQTIRRYPEPPEGQWWAPASYGGTAPTLEEAARLDAQERRDRAVRRRSQAAGG